MEKPVRAEPSSTEIGHGVRVQDEMLCYTLLGFEVLCSPTYTYGTLSALFEGHVTVYSAVFFNYIPHSTHFCCVHALVVSHAVHNKPPAVIIGHRIRAA
jgi:hypothetical protein